MRMMRTAAVAAGRVDAVIVVGRGRRCRRLMLAYDQAQVRRLGGGVAGRCTRTRVVVPRILAATARRRGRRICSICCKHKERQSSDQLD